MMNKLSSVVFAVLLAAGCAVEDDLGTDDVSSSQAQLPRAGDGVSGCYEAAWSAYFSELSLCRSPYGADYECEKRATREMEQSLAWCKSVFNP